MNRLELALLRDDIATFRPVVVAWWGHWGLEWSTARDRV
jgi:hypothetical protein